jgi:hypothetical protein
MHDCNFRFDHQLYVVKVNETHWEQKIDNVNGECEIQKIPLGAAVIITVEV